MRQTSIYAVDAELAALGDPSIYDFSHDAQRLPNGDTAVIAGTTKIIDVNGTPTAYNGDMVIVLDRNFQVVWVWNALDRLSPSRLPPLGEGPGDFTHANSVSYSPEDGDLLVSLRTQDWVLKCEPTAHRLVSQVISPTPHRRAEGRREPPAAASMGVG